MIARGLKTPSMTFDHLVGTMRPTLRLWDYFVNWDKVETNTAMLEQHLNIWNYLLGKPNFDAEFLSLLEKYPESVDVIPELVVRDGNSSAVFDILADLRKTGDADSHFDFSTPADTLKKRRAALEFVKKSGLVRIFGPDKVKNLVDYVTGVEAGLDSNARKNRGGVAMEFVVGDYLESFAKTRQLVVKPQARNSWILENCGIEIPFTNATRSFDFAVFNGNDLVLIETNFYGSNGSKLKATAGEYIELQKALKKIPNVTFVWITDGGGWTASLKPLADAFQKIDHIWNLSMLKEDFLGDLL